MRAIDLWDSAQTRLGNCLSVSSSKSPRIVNQNDSLQYDIVGAMRVALATDVAAAAAEELPALQTAEFFASRKARAEFKAFDKLMRRAVAASDRVPAMSSQRRPKTKKTTPRN